MGNQKWKISPVANVINDYSRDFAYIPSDSQYLIIVNDCQFKSKSSAERMRDYCISKYKLNHIVLPCPSDELRKGQLKSIKLNISSSQDIDLTISEEEVQNSRWEELQSGKEVIIKCKTFVTNRSYELKSLYPWFTSNELTLKDVKIIEANNDIVKLKGIVENISQYDLFIE